MCKLREKNPPQHFHYLQGSLYVDVGERKILLTAADGELEIPAWARNRAISGPASDDNKHTRFLLSGPVADGPYMLDDVFYENYYRYMDQVLAPGGEGISIIQILCVSSSNLTRYVHMFDAGGSCLALPSSIPFNMGISRGLLGYQPYYKEWTTDWETAKKRMQTSTFQKRFAKA
ncbi:hypothetical protein BS50DRAFT_603421 [Corynespora cassiicola Philippines]|uniref:Uncharacterized protein n=1 Tax=Corynespora cassiicola Philippines TaxID=1448308 RepID=A0A2T2NBM5_CORCC|nr:hypothetical protein BS50DRAFT_603421 [Corynespora cassiicola Philippines]